MLVYPDITLPVFANGSQYVVILHAVFKSAIK